MKLVKLAMLSLAVTATFTASARPARPVPYNVRQADGTEITLRTLGDEHFHFTVEAKSGAPVIKQNGTYFYAVVNPATGLAEASAVAVTARPTDKSFIEARENVAEAMRAATMQQAVITDNGISTLSTDSRATTGGFGLGANINGVPKNFVLEGDVPCLVLLVQFSDKKISTSTADINSWLNSDTPSAQWGGWEGGSVRSYYIKQSRNKFRPQFDLYGTATLSGTAASYQGREGTMLKEALEALQGDIDLKKYDVNGDGAVDNVYIIFAGMGGHLYSQYILPANATTNLSYQGLKINRYSYVNEVDDANYQQGIGTFVHEFGHVLGLADLYTTAGNYPSNSTNYWTPTYWDVMDTGCDLLYGYYPPNLSAFERHALGWTEPYELNKAEFIYMQSNENNGQAAMFHNPSDENEVFYFEYRDQTGWDQYHCGKGLLIWQIQFDQNSWNNNGPNNNSSNPRVRLVAADGSNGDNTSVSYYNTIFYKTDPYLEGDPFPGSTGNTEFSPSSSPAFLSAAGKSMNLANGNAARITSIGNKAKNGKDYMCFSVDGAPDRGAYTNVLGEDEVLAAITGIESDAADTFAVSCSGREVSIAGAPAGTITAFDVTGRSVVSAMVDTDGTATFTIPATGIYILRAGSASAKIIIR